MSWPARTVTQVSDVSTLVEYLSSKRLARYTTMTWRGAANTEWALDSGLARRLIRLQCDGTRALLTEAMLAAAEAELLADARRLQFDHHTHRPLTDLELLARLQHQGAATRLLDVTTNALLAAWFAVEDDTQNDRDGIVFGIDMANSELSGDQVDQPITRVVSTQHVWLWRPPPVDPRIRAQQGAFILSRVPPVTTSNKRDRERTSLALGFPKFNASRYFEKSPGSGRFPDSPVIIFRIPAAAKPSLRQFLTGPLGYTPDVLYPDIAGFARARRA